MSAPYIIYGMHASYFTQKVTGLFSFKDIPFEFRTKSLGIRQDVEKNAGTHLIPVVVTPEGEWLWDSTPIAFEMDRCFPDSAVMPDAPLARIITRVLEDFFDEWLTRPAVFFRWSNRADIDFAGTSLARDAVGIAQDAALDEKGEKLVLSARDMIQAWAQKVLKKLDAQEDARAEIESDFVRLMALLAQHFTSMDFLLGDRPCLADFALYGALKAHFLHDPTPKALIYSHAPALIEYLRRLDEAKASKLHDGDWVATDDVPETLSPILQAVQMEFHQFLTANHMALAAGENSVTIDLGYGPRHMAVRPYTEKTRRATADEFSCFDPSARAKIEKALGPLAVLEAYCL